MILYMEQLILTIIVELWDWTELSSINDGLDRASNKRWLNGPAGPGRAAPGRAPGLPAGYQFNTDNGLGPKWTGPAVEYNRPVQTSGMAYQCCDFSGSGG